MPIHKKIVWLLMLPWSIITRALSLVFLGGGLVFFLLGIACLTLADVLRKDKEWDYVDEIAEHLRVEQTSQHLLRMAKANDHRRGMPRQRFDFPDE